MKKFLVKNFKKNVENVFVNCPACDTKINIGENHKKFYKHNERAKA